MINSKILRKIAIFIISITSLFTFIIIYFVIPQINTAFEDLEKDNAKQTLNKVVSILNNVYDDIDTLEKYSLETNKERLKELTDTIWSLIETKYEETKPENMGNRLVKRSEDFQKHLLEFYEDNKNIMPEKELKNAIKNYIRIYRYGENGYFFAIDFDSNIIAHPINSELEEKNFKNIKDKNNVYFVNEMVNICKSKKSGFVDYIWTNPLTKKDEEKLSYVFKFEPYNWIIGTGEYKDTIKKQLKNEVISLIDQLRYGNDNYFFISDYNSTFLSHPVYKGRDFTKVETIKGNRIIPILVELARKKGQAYHEYWLKNTTKDKKAHKKISYVVNYPNWEMVIGTGVLLDDINKIINDRKRSLLNELEEIVNTTRIGKSGYLYVFDYYGNVIFHPNSNVKEKNLYDFKNSSSGNSIAEDLINASLSNEGTLNYKWDKPNDKGNYIYNKISWIKYLPKQKLYVASSVYNEDLEESSKAMSMQIITLGFAFLIILFLLSVYFFNKILSPLVSLSEYFLQAENGDYSVRSNINSDDEIGMVSHSFNKMVDKTEKLIMNLEKFVDNQENIVILTDGKNFNFANKKMFKFSGFKDLEHFLSKYSSISEMFIHNDRFFYPEKIQGEDNWVDKILSIPPKERIVSMLGADYNIYAFAVGINEFDENTFIISFSDISENVIEQIKLEEQTIRDRLTNAYNREYFEKNYKKFINEFNSENSSLAIAFLDIDYFKKVNDTYGHDVGDTILIEFVKIIQKYSRRDDILIRWGGEEFILILKISSKHDLKKVLDNLRIRISENKFSTVKHMTCSIGSSLYINDENIDETIKRADVCLYEAKADGRDKVIISG